MSADIRISLDQLASALKKIPEKDFIQARYDTEHSVPLRRILFILSTPRSGSTLLCDILRLNGVCLPHEYFQPYEYIPIAAARWECIRNGTLDRDAYVDALVRHRVGPKGDLGINLHGHHLSVFAAFEHCFGEAEAVFVHIRRRDVIAQAVSYEMAHQTGQWSSTFASDDRTPAYAFEAVRDRLGSLHHQDLLIDCFVKSRGVSTTEIFYEDLRDDPAGTLAQIPQLGGALSTAVQEGNRSKSALRRQASSDNEDWAARFAEDYLAEVETPASAPPSLARRLKHRAGRLLGRASNQR